MKLKSILTTLASISVIIATTACGNTQKTQDKDGGDSDTAVLGVPETQETQLTADASSIDWQIVMPEIVKNLPKESVPNYFRGKVGADSIEHGDYTEYPYNDNYYIQGAEEQETHYTFSAMAAPYKDGKNLFVIVNSLCGVDGQATLLLKTMNYNLESKQFSNISDNIPGVAPNASLLDLSWLSQHPDWIKRIKENYLSCSTYDLSVENGVCKITNIFSDNDVCYDIDDAMREDVPDWFDRLNLTYEWNGTTFELTKKKR